MRETTYCSPPWIVSLLGLVALEAFVKAQSVEILENEPVQIPPRHNMVHLLFDLTEMDMRFILAIWEIRTSFLI